MINKSKESYQQAFRLAKKARSQLTKAKNSEDELMKKETMVEQAMNMAKQEIIAGASDLDTLQQQTIATANTIGQSLSSDDPQGIAKFHEMWMEAKQLAGDEKDVDLDEVVQELGRQAPVKLDCNSKGSDDSLKGPTGYIISVICPEFCDQNENMQVIGDMIYDENSLICAAAIHAGMLTENGGKVRIKISNGESSYTAILRNGIQSQASGMTERAFIFELDHEDQIIDCDTNSLDSDKFSGPLYSIYNVNCPKNCHESDIVLYGTSIYSADSKICQAGMHQGVMTAVGGNAKMIIFPGQSSYEPSQQNGIQSQSKSVFFRSFKFIGDENSQYICRFYTEDYKNIKIFDNYAVNINNFIQGVVNYDFQCLIL